MSSNPAESSAARPTSPHRRPWSLTARLAVLTSLSSFLILAAVSTHMYFLLSSNLKKQNAFFLKDEVDTLAQLARFPEFKRTLSGETHVDPVGEEYIVHYIRLLDREGRKMIETPNMAQMLPAELFPAPKGGGAPWQETAIRGVNGTRFIGTAIVLDTPDMKQGTLQVALDVTNVEKVLSGYRTKLALSLCAGLLLCIAAGMAIARRGTGPLREITAKAQAITMDNLDQRLDSAEWPRELRAVADALNGMLDRLHDSFTRLYNSVANLTHKLRTPLTILMGEAEVALGRERSAEELREVIASGMEECERLSHLVNNIIFISQAEAGKPQHVPIKMKARAELEKVIDFYGLLADEKGVTISCTGNASLSADPTMFRMAAANLLSNALTFTSTGGTVAIRVAQRADGSAEFTVTDTGCGIDAADMPKIFDRFYRVYATRFMDPHGSGLGLTLVKTIMDLHDGTVEVRSVPGQGTTVSLQFPPPA